MRRLREGLFQKSSLLDDRYFRSFLFARFLAQTAQNAILYALLIIVVKETGRSIHSSLLLLCFVLPSAGLGLFAGMVVDLFPRQLILAVANVVRGGIALGLLLSGESVWAIYGYSLLLATVNQFAAPAELAALAGLVEPGQLMVANSLTNLVTTSAQLLGVVILTPLALKTVGSGPLFFLTAACFLAASVFLVTLPHLQGRGVQRQAALGSWRHQLNVAWRTLLHDAPAYNAVVLLVLAVTSMLIVATVVPQYVRSELGLPVENAVFIFAPAALGATLGLRLVARLEAYVGKNALTTIGFGVLVGGLVVLALVRPLSQALAGWNLLGLFEPGPLGIGFARVAIAAGVVLPLGFALAVINVAARALLNERIPLDMQGRVFALQTVVANVAAVLPLLLAGLLADRLGAAPVLLLVAAVILGLAFYSSYRAEQLRGAAS